MNGGWLVEPILVWFIEPIWRFIELAFDFGGGRPSKDLGRLSVQTAICRLGRSKFCEGFYDLETEGLPRTLLVKGSAVPTAMCEFRMPRFYQGWKAWMQKAIQGCD